MIILKHDVCFCTCYLSNKPSPHKKTKEEEENERRKKKEKKELKYFLLIHKLVIYALKGEESKILSLVFIFYLLFNLCKKWDIYNVNRWMH